MSSRSEKQKRRSAIIAELSRMSRDWSRYTAADWQPLEAELASLEKRGSKAESAQ